MDAPGVTNRGEAVSDAESANKTNRQVRARYQRGISDFFASFFGSPSIPI